MRSRRPFRDRREAGTRLGEALRLEVRPDPIVIGLPRGGVIVAAEVARVLDAPLDELAVRKLGMPGHEELAMGAIASGGFRSLNDEIVAHVRTSDLERVAAREHAELVRRDEAYRRGAPHLDVTDRNVVVVDDGLATGATMAVAVQAVRAAGAAHVTVAVPVAAPDTAARIERLADAVVVLLRPPDFMAVGLWYDDFRATTDDEVVTALAANRGSRSEPR